MTRHLQKRVRKLQRRYKFFATHPLTKDNPWAAVGRYIAFHLRHQFTSKPATYPFVNDLRYVTRPGMGYIAHNIYVGMHDFAEMGFLLHFLQHDELFVDVGANAGAYTLLAAGVCNAHVIAVEPVSRTCGLLEKNLALNELLDKVEIQNIALGASVDALHISITAADAWNHIVTNPAKAKSVEQVKVMPLDQLCAATVPSLLKIDVEGYEANVLAGAHQVLDHKTLKAIIIELNGSGRRFGFSDDAIHELLLTYNFRPYQYEPLTRLLSPLASFNRDHSDTIYLRDIAVVEERVSMAPSFRILGRDV